MNPQILRIKSVKIFPQILRIHSLKSLLQQGGNKKPAEAGLNLVIFGKLYNSINRDPGQSLSVPRRC